VRQGALQPRSFEARPKASAIVESKEELPVQLFVTARAIMPESDRLLESSGQILPLDRERDRRGASD